MAYYSGGDNNFGVAKWIVDSSAGHGTHTTIGTAMAQASTGDTIFIRPGSYTENFSWKAGVAMTAFGCDQFANVIINGKVSASTAGIFAASGIVFKTNSDYAIEITGSVSSTVYLNGCTGVGSNNSIMHMTSSGASTIFASNCNFDLQTTGIAYHTMTGGSNIHYIGCFFNNSGLSTTASNNSAGAVLLESCSTFGAFSDSSTGSLGAFDCNIDTSAMNSTTMAFNGTGANLISDCYIASGTAVPTTVGSGAVLALSSLTINTNNASICSGAGQCTYTGVSCLGNSTITSTSKLGTNMLMGGVSFDAGSNTLSNYATGTFTPGVRGASTAGTATYATQLGRYTRIGNRVYFEIFLTWSAANGTGTLQITGLPLTVSASDFGVIPIAYLTSAWGVGITAVHATANAGATTMNIQTTAGATGTVAAYAVVAAATMLFEGFYEV